MFFSLNKEKQLFHNLFSTVNEITLSFLLSGFIALFFSSLFWLVPVLHRVFNGYITTFNSLPKVAFAPMIIIILGSNKSSIILISLLISIVPCFLQISSSFRNTSKQRLN